MESKCANFKKLKVKILTYRNIAVASRPCLDQFPICHDIKSVDC